MDEFTIFTIYLYYFIIYNLSFNFFNLYISSLSFYINLLIFLKKNILSVLLKKCTLDISATSALFAAAERNRDYLIGGSTLARYLRHTDGRQGTLGKRFYGIILENAAATSISAENSFAFEK